jgi:CheY-like chemotaxis protein
VPTVASGHMDAGKKGPVILLVENDDNDVFFFRRALSSLNFQGAVHVVGNVTQARAYITGTGEFRDRSRYPAPDLIISDYKLHGETGAEFFHWLRIHPGYAAIPYVLFTGSATREEGELALRLGARAFFNKCADFEQMKKCVEGMLRYLPPRWPHAPLDFEQRPQS